jgi:hypothetical protein
VKTRNLLIWAFLAGLAIVIAGGVKLFQVADDKPTVTPLEYGETAEIGAMSVRVTDVTESADALLVHAEMRGVDGDSVGDHWRLLTGGEAIAPIALPDGVGTSCADTQVDVDLTCTVAFAPTDQPFVVAYLRSGNGQANWAPAD